MKMGKYRAWEKPASWSCVIPWTCLLVGSPGLRDQPPPWGVVHPAPSSSSTAPASPAKLCLLPWALCLGRSLCQVSARMSASYTFDWNSNTTSRIASFCEICHFLDYITSWNLASHWAPGTKNFPIWFCSCHLQVAWKSLLWLLVRIRVLSVLIINKETNRGTYRKLREAIVRSVTLLVINAAWVLHVSKP